MSNEYGAYQSWEKLLNPQKLKSNLIQASIFLTSYELLKNLIVGKLKTFYSSGFKESGLIIDDEYNAEVLSLHKKPFLASCKWFQDMNAITEKDMGLIHDIVLQRNKVAHELPSIIGEFGVDINLQLLLDMQYIENKITKWWVKNIELDINPAYENLDMDEIDIEGVQGTTGIFLQLLFNVANGRDDELQKIYEAMFKQYKG